MDSVISETFSDEFPLAVDIFLNHRPLLTFKNYQFVFTFCLQFHPNSMNAFNEDPKLISLL